MTSAEIRTKFLAFFEKRGHAIIPSAPLIPENDPTVLFNTAGMQPLVPYLMGEPHPAGKRIADVQKCVRTGDIDEIGDNTHLTFFEMLGNWSLGDYFKEDAIKWSYELLTSKEEGFGLDPNRLYVTVFEGNEDAPRDEESARIWESVGIPKHRIYFKGADANWWPAVKGKDTWTGPTGPCTEMFYDLTEEGLGDLTPEEYDKADDEQKVVEIWNDVFMAYEKKDGKIVADLKYKNVDTGAGLERITAVLQKKKSVFETDLFEPILAVIPEGDERSRRIIADHMRTSVFMIADGVSPANTDQGYVLRRLLRRLILKYPNRELSTENISKLVEIIIEKYGDHYTNLVKQKGHIKQVIEDESQKFSKTLTQGLKQFQKILEKNSEILGTDAFILFSTYGFPIEVTEEIAKEKGISVDHLGFEEEMKHHQDLSRTGAEGKFKGGLGDTSEMSVKYHTATHLLHQALHEVLGDHVEQKGSNITPERLRFDFSHPEKMTDEQKKQVEDIVNQKIKEDLPVNKVILPKEEALKIGAMHFFGDKYGDEVSVYYIGDTLENAYSKEFCGGPHVERTGILGKFKITKEESVAQGVRRIKAVLE